MSFRERIAKQKKEAVKRNKETAQQLAAANECTQDEVIDETLFYYQVFSLKFQMLDSLKENTYKPEHSFGSFINMYLELLESKTQELASNVSIDERFLNKLMNGLNWLPGNIAIRLELHSNNIIRLILINITLIKNDIDQIQNNITLAINNIRVIIHSIIT